jgi:parvulin-like peptidyl-prolyl isomerase
MALHLGCGGDTSVKDDPEVVAAYEGGVIRRAEFDAFEHRELQEDPQVAEGSEADWRVERIHELAVRKVLEDEVAADDPAVQAAVEREKSRILMEAMRADLGWNQLTVTQAELRAYYDAHPETFRSPEKVRLQHIYLRAEVREMPEAERESVRQKLEHIRQEILEGADFSEMAQEHSQSETARSGGWLILSADADVFPAFAAEVWGLEPQEISEIIETPTGFHLVKMVSPRPAIDRKFEDVLQFVQRKTINAKLDSLGQEFVREVGPRHGLERYYERLSDPFMKENEALVTIGEQHYTFADLVNGLSEHMTSQLYNAHFPRVYKFLDDVTVNRLLVKEAQRLELAKREDVAARIEQAAREARYETALQRRLMLKASELPEADIREYFNQNENRYQTLSNRDLDVILLKPEPGEVLWQTLRRAEELAERIRAGEDFAEIARTHSIHYSAANGGRMDRLTEHGVARLVQPRIHNKLKKLEEGEIMDPFVGECYDPKLMQYLHTGVFIIRNGKFYPPVQQSFEDVQDMVRGSYLRRNYKSMEDEVKQEVLESIDLDIYVDRLPAI